MKRVKEPNELTQKEIEKIWNFLVDFDKELSYKLRPSTDENIATYEKWIDCMYGIKDIILEDK